MIVVLSALLVVAIGSYALGYYHGFAKAETDRLIEEIDWNVWEEKN